LQHVSFHRKRGGGLASDKGSGLSRRFCGGCTGPRWGGSRGRRRRPRGPCATWRARPWWGCGASGVSGARLRSRGSLMRSRGRSGRG
jgi:hypothetical protein